MFEHLERELMEGEPWASGLVNSPIWNIETEKLESSQKKNFELIARQSVNSAQNLGYAKFWLPVLKLFS
ncbi:hypothetical protein ACE1CA_02700 [Aerosakkonemataceae cyanobacterium BLCC-F167]|uniref:Uncharacterized protein n=1 Tax=Floridaenema evergladense BLCC-F167 TaxID=3153639 RepID=A0ABV4WEC4_9CYAN